MGLLGVTALLVHRRGEGGDLVLGDRAHRLAQGFVVVVGPSGLILGIGFLMVAFTERKQGLHDMMADTLVVKTS